ncbi:UNVERIFIED_CONTAM: hypothetical protein NCL1_51501 [Trichonephila clavipes]
MAPTSHFSTRQCSASHGKGVTRLSQNCYDPSLACPIPNLSPIEHIWDNLGRRIGNPTSLNELEAGLQQIVNEMSQDIIQNLYASMPDRIASCIRAGGGSTSSVLLPFSLKKMIISYDFLIIYLIIVVITYVKFRFILTTPSWCSNFFVHDF